MATNQDIMLVQLHGDGFEALHEVVLKMIQDKPEKYELIESAAAAVAFRFWQPLSDGKWRMMAGDGHSYIASAVACSCPSRFPCKHRVAVQMIEAVLSYCESAIE